MSALHIFYNNLLDLCFIRQNENGQLETAVFDPQSDEEVVFPLKVNKKPIVFPENHFLTLDENKDAVVLHPLSESNLKTPSEIMEVLRRSAVVRICSIASYLLDKAVEINHNTTCDGSYTLNHKLSDLFKDVPDVDTKFVNWYKKLTKEISSNENEARFQYFNIHIKIDGIAGHNRYDRVTAITSPFYDYLVSSTEIELPVAPPRKKDLETLKSIITALFTELPKSGYVAGSNNNVAPTLLSFMEALSKMFKRLNNLLAIYGKEANDITNGNTKGTDWDRDQNFSKLRGHLPIQEFNVGKESIKRTTTGEAVIQSNEKYERPAVPQQMKNLLEKEPTVEQQPVATTVKPASTNWWDDPKRQGIVSEPAQNQQPPQSQQGYQREPQQQQGYYERPQQNGYYGNQGGSYQNNRYNDRYGNNNQNGGGYGGYGNQGGYGGYGGYGREQPSINDRYTNNNRYGNYGGYNNAPQRRVPIQPMDSDAPAWQKLP